MTETEGVIKYRLDFSPGPQPQADLRELDTWRSILRELDLIGQRADRYQGYGYGNISCRDPYTSDQFIISASQTGNIRRLAGQHYCTVERCDIDGNRVFAHGAMPPSSEALTHAMIYQTRNSARCVMHVHDKRLWQYGLQRGLPQTARSTEYGTLQMAREVQALFETSRLPSDGLLFMAGHEDGLLSFGDSIEEAGARMVRLWVEANLSAKINAKSAKGSKLLP